MNGLSEMERLAIHLKDRLDRPSDASDDSDSSIDPPDTNRFNKLKRKARHVARGQLDSGGQGRPGTQATFAYGSKRRLVVARPGASSSSLSTAAAAAGANTSTGTGPTTALAVGSSGPASASEDEDDAYHGIHLDQLLASVSTPADVPHHPQARASFKRPALAVLARQALRTLATEHAHRVALARLLTAFLGDDAVLLMQAYQAEGPRAPLRPSTDATIEERPEEATTMADAAIDHAATVPVPVKAVTRGQVADEASAALAHDFRCPTYDRNLGLPADSAEEARRLLQAALDRSEEYLRCLQKVRAGLLKADRYRGKIYGWCKDSDEAKS